MLSLKFIREHHEALKKDMKKRHLDPHPIDELLRADEGWRAQKGEIDAIRASRNRLSEEVNALKKQGKDASAALEKVKSIPKQIAELEGKMKEEETLIQQLLSKIPNIMHESVPEGKDASENPVIRTEGKPKKFSFPVKNHVELIEALGMADFDASAKISGSGFYFLEGPLALLNQALIQYAVSFMHKKGYTYVETPLMVQKGILSAALDAAAFADSIYEVKDSDLCMIGTSEHSLLGKYVNVMFQEHELPKKLFSYSMCFRKEIGSHGINEKGLWRTHQFNKVEQFVFCLPEDSYRYYDEMLHNTEQIMKGLKLPYRVIELCSGDMATWKAKSADIEVWRPTTKSYGEVASLSNCTEYQATDLNIRVIRKDSTRQMVHTLNNTALATSRIMVAILENCQEKDGSITVPVVLQPYMHGIKKISKKEVSHGAGS